MNTLPYLIFGGVVVLVAVLGAWIESALLVRRGWADSKLGMKFAFIANGVITLVMAILTYLMVTEVMLGALSGSKSVFASTVFPVLALAAPVLFFILRAVLMKHFQIGQGGARWLYAGICAVVSWITLPIVFMLYLLTKLGQYKIAST